MDDLETTIKTLRAQRSNLNRLIQTTPEGFKPTFLLQNSEIWEAGMRRTKTDLNHWIQRNLLSKASVMLEGAGFDEVDFPREATTATAQREADAELPVSQNAQLSQEQIDNIQNSFSGLVDDVLPELDLDDLVRFHPYEIRSAMQRTMSHRPERRRDAEDDVYDMIYDPLCDREHLFDNAAEIARHISCDEYYCWCRRDGCIPNI